MAIVLPIVTQYSGKGLDSAVKEIKKAEGGFGKLKASSALIGPAFAAAGVAVAAFAVKLGVDGVQAAMQEEKEVSKLSKTLENLNFGAATDSVNKFIDDLQYAVGVTDSELRPSFEKLVIATGSVAAAQTSLKLALDVSAGSGKSLDTVAQALSRGYLGNTTALSKLGAGLDKTTLKSGDMKLITEKLAKTFDGQATTAAGTLTGQMKILGIAVDELKESFGTGFINGIKGAQGSTEDLTQAMKDARQAAQDAGDFLGELGAAGVKTAAWLGKANTATKSWGDSLTMNLSVGILRVADALNIISDAQGAINEADYTAWSIQKQLEGKVHGVDLLTNFGQFAAVNKSAAEIAALKEKLNGATTATKANTSAVKAANPAWDAIKTKVSAAKEAFSAAGQAVADAKQKLNEYSDGVKDWVKGFDLGGAIQEQIDASLKRAELGKTIEAALASGDNEAAAQAAAELSAIRVANSWVDTFQKQIADRKAAAELVRQVFYSLDPSKEFQTGNKALIDALTALSPEQATLAAQEIIDKGLGPKLSQELQNLDLFAGDVGNTFAKSWYQPGVDAANTLYDAAKKALEADLDSMYQLGKKLGKSVADGYRDAIKGLPSDVRTRALVGSGGLLGASASGPVFNVTVNAGHGDPVAIARSIEATLRTANMRQGLR